MKTSNYFLLFIMVIIFAFCSGQSDKKLFDEAANLVNEKKYDEAVVIFNQLVEENTESELAPKALFESAKIYQGKVIKNLNSHESLQKSVEVYKKIYNNYPTTAEAENALFMAGFILANDLNDLPGAKEKYELYLEKYPNGQLADDAKIELQNLGKSPEEILKNKIQEDFNDETTI